MSRTFPFLATHSLACCDKGNRTSRHPPSPKSRDNELLVYDRQPSFRAARHTQAQHCLEQHSVSIEPTRLRTRNPPPNTTKKGEKKRSSAKQVTITHFCPLGLIPSRSGDQAHVATARAKRPISGSHHPTPVSWGHLVCPKRQVSATWPRHTTGRVIETRGHPKPATLSKSRPGRHALTLQGVTSPSPRAIQLDTSHVLKRSMISQPHRPQHIHTYLVPA